MKKISILIPFRNASQYIAACLESIQKQAEPDWEVIAVDDHSQDDSLRIVRQFADSDSRIKIYSNNGSGIIAGLRTAYANATGQLITRMDADDIMAEEKLSELKNLLMAHSSGVVATGLVRYFSDEKLGEGYQKYADWLNEIHKNDLGYTDIYKECVIPSPCWMIWREDLDRVGAFDSDIYPEDYDLCFRLYKQGLKIVSSKKILHYWRDYAQRTSRTDPRNKNQDFMALKLDRFLELEMSSADSLVIWGAGRKGKLLANLLTQKGIAFQWVCNNDKKHGKTVHNSKIVSHESLLNQKGIKALIAVAQRDAQDDIADFMEGAKFRKNKDYYFFC